MNRGTPWLAASLIALMVCGPARAQDVGREAAERLVFPELRFEPREPSTHEIDGVTVYLMEDPALPLVDVVARFQGGYGDFPREAYAAGTALPSLLRGGGTATLSPDSVDRILEFYAIQTSFGGGGGSTTASLNTLSQHLDRALDLWRELLVRPGFDSARLEVWRGQEMEGVRRRLDDPGRLAFATFNRLMFGDDPIGWEMSPRDLEPDRLNRDRLVQVHGRIFCRENLLMGVTGAVTWEQVRPHLERLVAELAPCPGPWPESPEPEVRRTPGVFLIPRPLEQSTVVLAHATELRQGDTPGYFASRIGNAILGASGLSSRLLTRVRTEAGLAYSASSLWTAPLEHPGLVGATTQTRADATVATIRLVLEVMDEMRRAPPRADEVAAAVDEATNGFVFNFESPGQVIARQMFYQANGLPGDWLSRYLAGVQAVRPEDVHRAFVDHLDTDRMVILVVGDPAAFDEPLEVLGPVTILDVADGGAPPPTSSPSGWRRSPW